MAPAAKQPGDGTNPLKYVPHPIGVGKGQSPDGERLLRLEDGLLEKVREVAEQRLRVLGRERAKSVDSWYYDVALPQTIFDLFDHYSTGTMRLVCLAFLTVNAIDDLSDTAKKEVADLLAVPDAPRLRFRDGQWRLDA